MAKDHAQQVVRVDVQAELPEQAVEAAGDRVLPVRLEIARVEDAAHRFDDRLRKFCRQLLAKQALQRGVRRYNGLERHGVALERDVTAIARGARDVTTPGRTPEPRSR